MVKVDDMGAEARYSRTRTLQAKVEQGLSLSGQEQGQLAELLEKPTRTTVRNYRKYPSQTWILGQSRPDGEF